MQPALHNPGNSMVVASARKVRPGAKQVDCISEDGLQFSVAYDTLVIATGSQASLLACTLYHELRFIHCIVLTSSHTCRSSG